MTSKEIWNIDDIIQDYENQGISGRSKQDFLIEVEQKLDKLNEYEEILNTPLIKIIQKLDILNRIEKNTHLFYSDRKKIALEFLKWAEENNAVKDDITNVITWFLSYKLREWLDGR